jgi:predicted house-cleaning noncanonical NTP pyrophosphatase (MazG superfamily)
MHNKLVRDNIPDIITAAGKQPIVHQADTAEYRELLLEKLDEELKEYRESGKDEELADLLEVIYALVEDAEALELLRKNKRDERGGFDRRIVLEEVR